MRKWVEWLMLETGGLFCHRGWHSWARGLVRWVCTHPREGVTDDTMLTAQNCRWCGVDGPDVAPTRVEAQRFYDDQWEALQKRHPRDIETFNAQYYCQPAPLPPPRTPAGKSRLQAPNSDRLRRTVALLHDKSTAEVAAEVMAAQCTHYEPLHAPGRDLSTGAVVGFGPMRDW